MSEPRKGLIGNYFSKGAAVKPAGGTPSLGLMQRPTVLSPTGVSSSPQRSPAPPSVPSWPAAPQVSPHVVPSPATGATGLGASTAKPVDLPRAAHRVMISIPVAKSVSDLPQFFSVLTSVGEPLELGAKHRHLCAALKVDEHAAAIVWTNEQGEAPAVRQHLADRLASKGFAVREHFEAGSTLVLQLNQTGTNTVKSTLAGLSIDADHIDKAVQHIVGTAVASKASDIHIEVSGNGALIRYRIHGELYAFGRMEFAEADEFSRGLYLRSETGTKAVQFDPHQCLDSSVKLDVTVPGTHQVVPLKLRFASKPAYPEGWDITLRLLTTKSEEEVESFADLGYDTEQVTAFEAAAAQPRGVILMVGETGSGKSTTLRTICYYINDQTGGRKKIISVEDPPEYILPGRQTPVLRTKADEENGIDPFARYLKSCMRSDPDVLLVGEIRDEETARAMTTASLSGHKVLATLHTGSPFDVFARLEEMGIKRSLLVAPRFISGIVFQKLVPILCPNCSSSFDEMKDRLPAKLMSRIIRVVATENMDKIRFRGPGCRQCVLEAATPLGINGPVGVIGRTVIAEVLVPDAQILDLVGRGDQLGAYRYWRAAAAPKADIDTRRVAMGRTVLDQAIAKMSAGLLDPRDVEQAAGPLDDQESPREALRWWEANRPRLEAASAQRLKGGVAE